MNKETAIDKKTLSKTKYIYKLYRSYKTKEFHCERYSIVYLNSEFVYFKTGRKSNLDMVRTSAILDKLTSDIDLDRINRYGLFFWDAEEETDSIVADLKERFSIDRKAKTKLYYEKRAANLRAELAEVETLLAQIE